MKLWGLFKIFEVCCSLWIFLGSSTQEGSGMSDVFIQVIISWVWGCACTGKLEDAQWQSGMGSICSKDGAKPEHPDGEPCRTPSVHSRFQHVLLLPLPLLCRLCRIYICLCYLLTVLNSSWGGITALDGKCSIGALHSWRGQLCLSPAVETSGTVKENVFDMGSNVVKRWIMNQKSWQYWWLDLKGTGGSSRDMWLLLWRGERWSAHLRPIQTSPLIWLKTNCLISCVIFQLNWLACFSVEL